MKEPAVNHEVYLGWLTSFLLLCFRSPFSVLSVSGPNRCDPWQATAVRCCRFRWRNLQSFRALHLISRLENNKIQWKKKIFCGANNNEVATGVLISKSITERERKDRKMKQWWEIDVENCLSSFFFLAHRPPAFHASLRGLCIEGTTLQLNPISLALIGKRFRGADEQE